MRLVTKGSTSKSCFWTSNSAFKNSWILPKPIPITLNFATNEFQRFSCRKGRNKMTGPFELPAELEHFSGRIPLFPLPNLVLFPHILQPLHIFEPRYRKMVADALTSERLLALALLKPGWEREE